VIESPSAVIFQEPVWGGNEGAALEPLAPAAEALESGCSLGSNALLAVVGVPLAAEGRQLNPPSAAARARNSRQAALERQAA